MKRLFVLILALGLVLAALAPAAFATEVTETTEATEPVVREPGWCGEDLTWKFESGVLTITGSGEMDNYGEGAAPWYSHKDEITRLVLSGVTYIGSNAFRNFDALETVDFGNALYEIGPEAFRGCDGLTSIHLPESFKIFGESSLLSCANLTEIHSAGRFPSFRENCLWDTYATIYYPVERPWSVEYIKQLEEAFRGRIEFLAEDGTDHYEPTEAATEPEETVPETTVPETEAPTEATIPVTEPPVTEAPTEAVTEPPVVVTQPAETEESTEAPAPTEPEGESSSDGISTGLTIIGVVLGLMGVGALIFGGRRGRYSR